MISENTRKLINPVKQTKAERHAKGTAGGGGREGLVGPRPHDFFGPPSPLFAQKRKIIKIKKKNDLKQIFSVYILLYSLYFL